MRSHKLIIPFVLAGGLVCLVFGTVTASAQARKLDPNQQPQQFKDTERVGSAYSDIPEARQANAAGAPLANGVITNVLSSGDDLVHGLIYYNGYLWASTRTAPARILKINPDTLAVDDRITLPGGQNDGEDIIAAMGYVWVILYDDPSLLIRVDPDTAVAQTALTFDSDDFIFGDTFEYAFGYLWVGGLNRLARVDISNPILPAYQAYIFDALVDSDYGLFHSLTSSQNDLWGTFHQFSFSLGEFYATTIVRIDPSDPVGSYITETIPTTFPDDSIYLGDNYYLSSESNTPGSVPSDLYQFSDDLVVSTTVQIAESGSYGLFLETGDPNSFWGAYVGSPGTIININLDLQKIFSSTLPTGFDDPSEIAFDDTGNLYVATWQSPAGLVKYSALPPKADLSISSTASADPVVAGEGLTYTLVVSNQGPSDASGVVVTDTLPGEVVYSTANPSPDGTDPLVWDLGSLAAGTSQTLTVVVSVDPGAVGPLSNQAAVSSQTTDPAIGNNSAVEFTAVTTQADLGIEISDLPDPVVAGQGLTYTLVVSNQGPSDASGVVVTDTLPGEVVYSTANPSPDGTDPLVWDLGSLAAGASQTLTVIVSVDAGAVGPLGSQVAVSSQTTDPAIGNNSAVELTAVTTQADLGISHGGFA